MMEGSTRSVASLRFGPGRTVSYSITNTTSAPMTLEIGGVTHEYSNEGQNYFDGVSVVFFEGRTSTARRAMARECKRTLRQLRRYMPKRQLQRLRGRLKGQLP